MFSSMFGNISRGAVKGQLMLTCQSRNEFLILVRLPATQVVVQMNNREHHAHLFPKFQKQA